MKTRVRWSFIGFMARLVKKEAVMLVRECLGQVKEKDYELLFITIFYSYFLFFKGHRRTGL